jgi:hypothetical protein
VGTLCFAHPTEAARARDFSHALHHPELVAQPFVIHRLLVVQCLAVVRGAVDITPEIEAGGDREELLHVLEHVRVRRVEGAVPGTLVELLDFGILEAVGSTHQ